MPPAPKIVAAFSDVDHHRGYVCVAPDRRCSPQITITTDGVWFRTAPLAQLQSAHRGCVQSAPPAS